MKFKRLVSITLVLVLMLSIGMTSVYANGWGNGKVPKGLTKKFPISSDIIKRIESYLEKLFGNGFLPKIKDGKYDISATMEIKNGKIVSLEITDMSEEGKKIVQYSGTIVEINKSKPYKLAIKSETMISMFEVVDDVEVIFKDKKGAFSNIEKGDEVIVEVDNANRITKVEVERKLTEPVKKVSGTVTSLEFTKKYNRISIDKKTYDIASNVKVRIDGKNKSLADLKIGMYTEVLLEKGVVVQIDARNVEKTIEGEIRDIIKDSLGTTLKIEEETTGKIYYYSVSKDAKVHIEGLKNIDLDDLLKGDEGKFTILNGVIVKIEIED